MDLAPYKEKLRSLAESWFREERKLSTTKRCCISFKLPIFSILCIDEIDGTNKVILLDKIKLDTVKSLPLILTGMIEQYQLNMIPIYWLLDADDYQLNLIEAMPVPEGELQKALSWRVRSLIKYPIDEAVLEYFQLPAKKNNPNAPLIGAVTAQKTRLATTISMLKESGLSLVKIDIPELALLKLAATYETDEKSTAFIYFYEKFIILNISNRKTLYFTRRINFSHINENEIDTEALSLEIMRYFDFYRSQWRLSSPTRILAASENMDIQETIKKLSERLTNPVDLYSLRGSLVNEKYQMDINTKYLLDYGCLLK